MVKLVLLARHVRGNGCGNGYENDRENDYENDHEKKVMMFFCLKKLLRNFIEFSLNFLPLSFS